MKEQSEPFLKSACLAAYYAALALSSLLAILYVIFSEASLLYFILIVPICLYASSMLFEVDAFATAALLIANFTKYRKVHPPTPLPEPAPTPTSTPTPTPIPTPVASSRRISRLAEREVGSAKGSEERVRVVRREKERSGRKWGEPERSSWLKPEEVENAYKRQRNLFKMTLTQVGGKGWKTDDLEQLIQYSKETYQVRVGTAVNNIENKIIELFDALERYYDVSITSGHDSAHDLRNICLTPQQVYDRLEHYDTIRLLPWPLRPAKQPLQTDPAPTLSALYKQILAMDRIISPFRQLEHHSRMEKITLIKKEMREGLSLNALHCVVGVFNSKRQQSPREQLFLLRQDDSARLSLDIKWYNDKLITSLVYLEDDSDRQLRKAKDESKAVTLYSQPGELNIWNTIAWTKVIHRATRPPQVKKQLQSKPN